MTKTNKTMKGLEDRMESVHERRWMEKMRIASLAIYENTQAMTRQTDAEEVVFAVNGEQLF